MLNGCKIIGLCLTKIHDEISSDFVQSLYNASVESDYRLMIFNSFLDFYKGNMYDRGASSIYKAINYDLLDMVIIMEQCFYDKNIIDEIIKDAAVHGVPVLIVYGKHENCFSIQRNYNDSFRQLVEHIIVDHKLTDIHFIAGSKGEEQSETRLECCRKVMAEHGLELSNDRISYGDYWELPTNKIVDELIKDNRLPEAFICANDIMAISVCERLKEYGKKVPGDVVITGFDGLKAAAFYETSLTTCYEDINAFAAQCFDIIRGAVENGDKPYDAEEKFKFVIGQSCGCKTKNQRDYRLAADMLYSQIRNMTSHENVIFNWADRIFDSTEPGVIGNTLNDNILPGSSVALNSDFIVAAKRGKNVNPGMPFTEKMIILSARDKEYAMKNQEVFKQSEVYPNLGDVISDKKMYILQSIYVKDLVCGYYMFYTDNIRTEMHKLHRLCRIMNLAFNSLINRIQNEHLSINLNDIKKRDTQTGLLNLHGLIAEINNRYETIKHKRIAVSVYNIPQYKYIFETFGINDADDAVDLVSETLQLANPRNSYVARIEGNEFIVINIEDPEDDIGSVITNSVEVFFSITESYNKDLNKDYYVEVNCGCTVVEPVWENNLISFIKLANGEMYLNRLKSGNGPVLKEHNTTEDLYKKFDILIKKNLFIYYFQPIVNAKTGEIYAYEALMRTTGNIDLDPGQILETARTYNRLYDVEIATFRNILSYIDGNRDKFKGHKIFINTIPGFFLTDSDYEDISEKYKDIFNQCTIEITEQNDISDEELRKIKSLGGEKSGCKLAVDDYGAGYSNIVNLLRYEPHVIKIDRFLITDIHKDTNKQMFVKSTIEFAHMNKILTIAEGVETLEELNTVISYGIDLIQGFYTARPAPEPLEELPEKIKLNIINANNI